MVYDLITIKNSVNDTVIAFVNDAISCLVTEEKNGIFELSLEYSSTGSCARYFQTRNIITAKPNPYSDPQCFRIYKITKAINGKFEVMAEHISYDLIGVPVKPFTATSISDAITKLGSNSLVNHPFEFTTDIDSNDNFTLETPSSYRSVLGGDDFSFLSNYGGEFEFDNYEVTLHASRGSYRGASIRYGKNLTALSQDEDSSVAYSGVYPWWSAEVNETNVYVDLPEKIIPTLKLADQTETTVSYTTYKVQPGDSFWRIADKMLGDGTRYNEVAQLNGMTSTSVIHPGDYLKIPGTQTVSTGQNDNWDFTKVFILDLCSEFEEQPTVDQLRTAANKYIADYALADTKVSLTVEFAPLEQTEEYKDIAVLETVGLCDYVDVNFYLYNINTTMQCIKTVYDALLKRYKSVELGEEVSSLDTTVSTQEKKINKIPKRTEIAEIAKNSGRLITGGLGGYVVMRSCTGTGKPDEMLIMDTDDINTATKVWRWNQNGLGFSNNGYNGEYDTAITSDGTINADFITTGVLNASVLTAGIIESTEGDSYWNLDTGEVHLSSYVQNSEIEEKMSVIDTNAANVEIYLSSINEFIEDTDSIKGQIASLVASSDDVTLKFQDSYTGGINLIQNSAGLNGVSDWDYNGSVVTMSSANTVSKSIFKLTNTAFIEQTITDAIPGEYVFSVRACKPNDYGSVKLCIYYNGSTDGEFIFNEIDSFGWKTFDFNLNIVDPVIRIKAYVITDDETGDGELQVSDMIIAEGNTKQKWSPAPNEIYTSEVKIDKSGINISNGDNGQRTIIDNTEFSGYYGDELVFSLNGEETKTKKTTVDGELTVGQIQFKPDENGLSIIVL